MISVQRYPNQEEEKYTEYCGLSIDEKPSDYTIQNGDEFKEIDTGKIYKFDGANRIWYE